jgi:hypothetical protein
MSPSRTQLMVAKANDENGTLPPFHGSDDRY